MAYHSNINNLVLVLEVCTPPQKILATGQSQLEILNFCASLVLFASCTCSVKLKVPTVPFVLGIALYRYQ